MEQRGLSAAGRAEQAGDLTRFDCHIDMIEHIDALEALNDALDDQLCHCLPFPCRGHRSPIPESAAPVPNDILTRR